MRAVITAGGLVEGEFAEAIGTRVKALAPLGARTLLDVVLDACAGAGIDGVAVIGGAEVRAHLAARGVRVIDAALDGGTNVLRALDAWPGERFVYLTSDMPFASAERIARADRAQRELRADDGARRRRRVRGAVSRRGRAQRRARRRARRERQRVRDRARSRRRRCARSRRSCSTRARACRASRCCSGPALCWRFATKRLTIADLEAYGRRRLGVAVGALRDCDPGLCYDVDSLADYRYACTHSA